VSIVPITQFPCCGAAMRSPIMGAGDSGFDLARCGQCRLVHALGHHASALLDQGYGERAQTHDEVDRSRKRLAVELYDRLSHGRIASQRPGARALDLGCNTGLLLDVLAERGWITEGVERAPAAARFAAAHHRIHDLDLEDEHASTGARYQLVTITHVLEHMRKPVSVAGFIARHLADDGIAVIEVPNWDDAARKLWGRRYRPLELGDHVCFFDRATLQRTLELGGLRVETVWSRPQGATLVMPSVLSAVDTVKSFLPRRRAASTGALSARPGARERASGGLRARVLHTLDRLDPLLERFAGDDPRWGANLVAIASRR
jgi:2-polyprenyl-3-methyl-5-hydroxy-6-metoxy-1,4-benzoquinol methylase